MAKREVVDCDRCGQQAVAHPAELVVCLGRGLDAAGSHADDVRHVDLCRNCSGVLAGEYLRSLEREQVLGLFDEWQRTLRLLQKG